MMRKSRIVACALVFCLCSALQCEEEKDPITIRIFCYSSENNAGFAGWYIKNGESPQFFTITTPQGSVYYHEIILEDVDEIEIEVITLQASSSLAIKIYKDQEKVKEVSQDASSYPRIIRLNVTYKYGESSKDSSRPSSS
ncbi:MAG: hypothetical protein N2316_10875 [Spirochaetes bacterium]|nr:hypothetical protein [Spirochaetota bacterium]